MNTEAKFNIAVSFQRKEPGAYSDLPIQQQVGQFKLWEARSLFLEKILHGILMQVVFGPHVRNHVTGTSVVLKEANGMYMDM